MSFGPDSFPRAEIDAEGKGGFVLRTVPDMGQEGFCYSLGDGKIPALSGKPGIIHICSRDHGRLVRLALIVVIHPVRSVILRPGDTAPCEVPGSEEKGYPLSELPDRLQSRPVPRVGIIAFEGFHRPIEIASLVVLEKMETAVLIQPCRDKIPRKRSVRGVLGRAPLYEIHAVKDNRVIRCPWLELSVLEFNGVVENGLTVAGLFGGSEAKRIRYYAGNGFFGELRVGHSNPGKDCRNDRK